MARYYDGTSGRFLSPDPLGHGASMDLYSFADGDPLNNFDPDGRLFAGTLNGAGQWGSQMYAGLGNALDAALHAIVSPWNPLTATRNFSGGYEADFRYQRNFDQGTAAFQLGHQLGYAGAEIGFQMGMFAGPMAFGRMASTAAMRSASGIGAEAVTARYVTSAQGLAQRAASATRTPIVSLQGPTMTRSTGAAADPWVSQPLQKQMEGPATGSGAVLRINQPAILNNPNLTGAARRVLNTDFRIKMRALQSAARRGELSWSPGTDSVRIGELQAQYRDRVIARYQRRFGAAPDIRRLDADHMVDLIVGGAGNQRLKLIHQSINRSVGSSLKNAGERLGLRPGDPISGIIVNP